MIQSIIDAFKAVGRAIIDFLLSCVNFICGFLVDVVQAIWDFVKEVFIYLWQVFQHVQHEIYVTIYNLIKEAFASYNLPFPAAMPNQIYYWYHQINQFFPLDACIDGAFILINTFLVILFIKMMIKIKLKIGGMFTGGIFK